MPPLSASLPLFGFFSLLGLTVLEAQGADGQRPVRPIQYEPDHASGSAAAVEVGAVGLIHTTQLFPLDTRGNVFAPGKADDQITALLDKLELVLGQTGRRWNDVVKLNCYAADAAVADKTRAAFSRKFAGFSKPATTYVVGKLAHAGALVALDAVIVDDSSRNEAVKRTRSNPPLTKNAGVSDMAWLPPGRRVYISGQAEAAKTMAEGTRLTLESLKRTLEHLGLTLSHVVQIKSFLGPIAGVADAEREIVKFFGGASTPPLVFVEWSSNLPIEIELLAWGGAAPARVETPIEYLTPPGMTASPLFCRVTRVNSPETIYISGLYGTSSSNGEAETREIFESLKGLLDKTGSDFQHLAKATYYVATEEASTKLNEIRPSYYNPQRPPAASKAVVNGTGRDGRTITVDMIAVRKGPAGK